ncbi:hypothetical protein PENCOP_c014G03463 [Penicillium coprophilum]|uniref:Xylanolytic transcriptional activator regulatory domain-containing protein n=1 Tax=Penicillium coprophilum TaxID=36646 RepID=A0A1V6U9B5_9EURO|nr:hypothetical protein PENCOP_c014G03463 [Penicillium coprophilum]
MKVMNQPRQPAAIQEAPYQSRQLESRATTGEPTRVCDSCIRKKAKLQATKGDQPAFVASSEEKLARREPHATRQASSVEQRPLFRPFLEPYARPISESSPQTSDNGQSPAQYEISTQQEEYLLDQYFEIAQDANPIFSKANFLDKYRNSLCNEGLISVMVTITAKLIGYKLFPEECVLNTRIDLLLGSSLLEDDIVGDSPSLDQFRKACMLALYDFHQFPGHQSWMRIGRLTRMAYRIGLDRLEPLRAMCPDWGCLSKEDIEEWRSVWWCIYRLDSYSNLSSGTPYLIDNSFVNTSLLLDACELNGESSPLTLYLPGDSEHLWKLLPTITSNLETRMKNIHIISISAMRQAGLVAGIRLLRPQEEIASHLVKFERHLSALCLALPHGWFNPGRNAFTNESPLDHHARLITVFHLRMARLLSSIVACSRTQDDGWMSSWQQVLETCQDIAHIAGQWNSSFCIQVDPAICFIIFTALIFLDLHMKSTGTASPELLSTIDHDKTVLRLQLDQFARIWTLPRLLSLSFAGFSESVSGPLSHRQITLILSRFEAPLHPRWLGFLSTAQATLAAFQ